MAIPTKERQNLITIHCATLMMDNGNGAPNIGDLYLQHAFVVFTIWGKCHSSPRYYCCCVAFYRIVLCVVWNKEEEESMCLLTSKRPTSAKPKQNANATRRQLQYEPTKSDVKKVG
jgi:hypothetical protein